MNEKVQSSITNSTVKEESSQLLNETIMLKQQIGIMKGREIMRTAISNSTAALITDIPIEYVQFCTRNFDAANHLGQGGAGDIFLAVDSQVDPKIQYVAKRVHVDNVQAEKADTFRRELEVKKADLFDLLSNSPIWFVLLIRVSSFPYC